MPYGYCPICGAPGYSRERRPNGNDVCSGVTKHTYPSASALKEPRLDKWEALKRWIEENKLVRFDFGKVLDKMKELENGE